MRVTIRTRNGNHAKAIDKHNAAVDENARQWAETERALTQFAEQANEFSFAELKVKAEANIERRLSLKREKVTLQRQRLELLKKLQDELASDHKALTKDTEAAEKKARKDLIAAGVGPETDPFYESRPELVERKFQAKVNQLPALRTLQEERRTNQLERNAIVKEKAKAERDIEEAEKDVQLFVRRLWGQFEQTEGHHSHR